MNPSAPLPVIIEPYDPEWPNLFLAEKARLDAVLHSYIDVIEHVGSTSVPGLAAKPVIDILVGIHSLGDTPQFVPLLQAIGYIYVPEYEVDLPERRYLKKVTAIAHTHHLHLAETNSKFFHDHIHFRDVLRAHPDVAAAYAELKLRLAAQYRNDRSAYTNAKSDFIQKALLLD
jgi:GrpB-like predicted nucleotidyltransferase (UPF0157 family)